MPSIRLREFLPEDLEAAWELDQVCFERGIAFSRSEIRQFLARPGSVALTAEAGGQLVGFAIADRRGARGHIVTIDVAASERRRGLGKKLLSGILKRLEADGARQVRLEVDVRNAAAMRFYEKMGFTPTRILRGYYGRGLDGQEMVRGE